MQATIQFYFSTLAPADVEHILATLLGYGATHYGRSSWISTPVVGTKEVLASAGYATSFALRGASTLGSWTAEVSITP